MTFEEEFNKIIIIEYYGDKYYRSLNQSHSIDCPPYVRDANCVTEMWTRFHGSGFGEEMFKSEMVPRSGLMTLAIKPKLCSLIDNNPTLALTSSDLFIREYTQAYMEDK
jgi:hypothetical protein